MNKNIKESLSFIISFLELLEIQRLKAKAVREQDFQLAAKYRDEEKILQKDLPNLEQLKQLRDEIFN